MGEGERAVLLGLVLKRIAAFDISTFGGRLVLQKTIYLLQSFGFYMGYKFSWYIHGPYSPELTKDAFKLQTFYEDVPIVKFHEMKAEASLEKFKRFIGNRRNDADWLEQLACTHFLEALNPSADEKEIIKTVMAHEYHFTRQQCQQAWDYLVDKGLIAKKRGD